MAVSPRTSRKTLGYRHGPGGWGGRLVSFYKRAYWRNQSGDGTATVSLFDFDMEIPALERLILDMAAPSKNVGEAK